MAIPQLDYTISHYVQNKTTAEPELETFDHIPTTSLRVSDKNPYNTINVGYTPDISLIYYECRVTRVGDEYGIGKGTRLYYAGPNIANHSNNTFTITINKSIPQFATDGACLLGFYAKSSDSSGLWDATYLLISSDDYIVAPNNYDGIELLTNEPIPES